MAHHQTLILFKQICSRTEILYMLLNFLHDLGQCCTLAPAHNFARGLLEVLDWAPDTCKAPSCIEITNSIDVLHLLIPSLEQHCWIFLRIYLSVHKDGM